MQTRAKFEKKVTGEFSRRDVEAFLPLVPSVRRWTDRRKVLDLPLFSCYVFVRIHLFSPARLAVLQTPGVLRFVAFNGEVAPIPQDQIDGVRVVLATDTPFSCMGLVKPGQRVRIRGGALNGVEGTFLRVNGGNKLVVCVDSIQRSLVVSLDGYDIEAV